MTFVELNRRMDCWLHSSEVTVDNLDYECIARIQAQKDHDHDEQADLRDSTLANLFPNDEHKGMDQKQIEEHESLTKLKTINFIQLGHKFKIRTWYFSPYPS